MSADDLGNLRADCQHRTECQSRLLKNDRDGVAPKPAHLALWQHAQVETVKLNRPRNLGARWQQSENCERYAALTASGRTREPNAFAFFDGERRVIDSFW
jgi:hypothetical protein